MFQHTHIQGDKCGQCQVNEKEKRGKKLEYKWHPKGKKEKRGRYKCNECGECVYKFCW